MSDVSLVVGKESGARAVILGPVTPVWDRAEFCSGLVNFLVDRGYQVVVVDTPALIEGTGKTRSSRAVLEVLADQLRAQWGEMSLLAGYALGASLAVKLSRFFPKVPRVLSISGPGFVDAQLQSGIRQLLARLEARQLTAALELLSALVAPVGQVPNAMHKDALGGDVDVVRACERMRIGFEFLLTLDVREEAAHYAGDLLCLVGELAQLATADNQAVRSDEEGRLVCVPGAGMRVLKDNPRFVLQVLGDWLNK